MKDTKARTAKPLADMVNEIDRIQGRRFGKLAGVALAIATTGILRHLRACRNMEVRPDVAALREIIDDALNGRRVYDEVKQDWRAA